MRMEAAISAVKESRMNQSQAGAEYGIPPSMISKTLTGRRCLDTKKGRKCMLPAEVEDIIEMYCLTMSDAAHGICAKDIGLIAREMMLHLRPDCTGFTASSTWVTGFLERHPRVSKRRAQALDRTRAGGLNKDQCTEYFNMLGDSIKFCEDNSPGGQLPANFRLNLDESAAIGQGEGKCVIGRKGASSIHTLCDGVRAVNCRMSQVAMISAGDHIFTPSYIIEGVEEPVSQIHEDGGLNSLPPQCKWALSPKGSLTDENWDRMVVPDIIEQITRLREKEGLPDQWALLTLDGFTSHSYCIRSLTSFYDSKIMLLRLPSHSSHALQALDVTVYHPLKSHLREAITHVRAGSHDALNKWDLLRLFHKCWELSMEGNALAIAGMRKVGIQPYNPNWVEDHSDVFKPSQAFSTSGDNAAMARICQENDEVHLLSDASSILTATRLLDKLRQNRPLFENVCQLSNVTIEDVEMMLMNVKLAKFANNPINAIIPHPWWDRLCIQLGEARYEEDGQGNARRIGNNFESRSASMVLNFPERVERLRVEEERKHREACEAEANRREKQAIEAEIVKVMQNCGGYLDDTFDPRSQFLKSDVVKLFFRNNDLKRRDDYFHFFEQVEPPREVRQGLLLPQAIEYLDTLIRFNASLDVCDESRIDWV